MKWLVDFGIAIRNYFDLNHNPRHSDPCVSSIPFVSLYQGFASSTVLEEFEALIEEYQADLPEHLQTKDIVLIWEGEEQEKEDWPNIALYLNTIGIKGRCCISR